MTNPKSRNVLTASLELERISADLLEVQEDLALLERLKGAQEKVSRLTTAQEKATKELDKAKAAEAKAAKAARFSGISDLRITESPLTMREHVLSSSWTIHWTKPTWDGRSNPPKQHSCDGFTVCPPDVLEYLIERCPERVPAKIIDLAPDDPREAFGRYFRGLKRGCLVG